MLVTVTAKQDQTWKTIQLNFASSDFDNENLYSDSAVATVVAATTLATLSLSLF
jgi:hypothetical protein